MSVKASVSISESQDAFARDLVMQGRYSSLSAVVQRGLDLLREESERSEAEIAALRMLISSREAGPFLSAEEGNAQTEAMIDAKRRERGL